MRLSSWSTAQGSEDHRWRRRNFDTRSHIYLHWPVLANYRGDMLRRSFGYLIVAMLSMASASGCGSSDAGPAEIESTPTFRAPAGAMGRDTTPPADPGNAASDLRTYLHPSGLWEVSYLSGAQISGPVWDEVQEFEGVEFTSPLSDESFLALGITRLEGREYRTSEEWSLSILERTEESSSSYELLSWEQYAVGAFLGYEAVFSRTGGAFDFAHIELHVVAGTGTYRVVGVTDQAAWSDNEELLRTLVHSFRLGGR